jgi:hypothetical protein
MHFLRRVVAVVVLLYSSGCYRYQLSPEAEVRQARAEELQAVGKRAELCDFLTAPGPNSVQMWEWMGECLHKPGTDDTRLPFYRAALCGSSAGNVKTTVLCKEPVYEESREGEASYWYLLPYLFDAHDESLERCGLVKTPTAIGWVLLPVGFSLELLAFAGIILATEADPW